MVIYVMKKQTFFKDQKGQIYKDDTETFKKTKIEILVLIKGSDMNLTQEISIHLVKIKFLEM